MVLKTGQVFGGGIMLRNFVRWASAWAWKKEISDLEKINLKHSLFVKSLTDPANQIEVGDRVEVKALPDDIFTGSFIGTVEALWPDSDGSEVATVSYINEDEGDVFHDVYLHQLERADE